MTQRSTSKKEKEKERDYSFTPLYQSLDRSHTTPKDEEQIIYKGIENKGKKGVERELENHSQNSPDEKKHQKTPEIRHEYDPHVEIIEQFSQTEKESHSSLSNITSVLQQFQQQLLLFQQLLQQQQQQQQQQLFQQQQQQQQFLQQQQQQQQQFQQQQQQLLQLFQQLQHQHFSQSLPQKPKNLKPQKVEKAKIDVISNINKDVSLLPPFNETDFMVNLIDLHTGVTNSMKTNALACVLLIFCATSRVFDEIGREKLEIIKRVYKDKSVYLVIERPVSSLALLGNTPNEHDFQEIEIQKVAMIVHSGRFLEHTKSQLTPIADHILSSMPSNISSSPSYLFSREDDDNYYQSQIRQQDRHRLGHQHHDHYQVQDQSWDFTKLAGLFSWPGSKIKKV